MSKEKRDTILGTIGLILFLIVYGIIGTIQTTYKLNGTVIKTEQNRVVFKDDKGEIWVFYGEGFDEGDRIIAKMFNNDTSTTYDDCVESVKILEE